MSCPYSENINTAIEDMILHALIYSPDVENYYIISDEIIDHNKRKTEGKLF